MDVYPNAPSAALFGGSTTGYGERPVHRYALSRRWDSRGPLVMLLLNPSTADAMVNDPTISRAVLRARREGFGGLLVVNLFAWRATYPDHLISAEADHEDIVGPDNDEAIRTAAQIAHAGGRMLVAGWGAPSRPALRRLVDWRMDTVVPMIREILPIGCIGTAANGWPRHPLYVKNSAPIVEWRP